jgi:hypothetical protein
MDLALGATGCHYSMMDFYELVALATGANSRDRQTMGDVGQMELHFVLV